MATRITTADVELELNRLADEVEEQTGLRPEFTLYMGSGGSVKINNHVVDPRGNVFSNGDLGQSKADIYRAVRAAGAILRYTRKLEERSADASTLGGLLHQTILRARGARAALADEHKGKLHDALNAINVHVRTATALVRGW